ncbi:MAG: helix-turn-helix transcriptional regulator [Oscillospiraceae bacterium]|nr:helix-turn-helix transcriptional regulator [Oscillospiraceae bacterium]
MLTTAEMEQCSLDTALIGKRIKQARKAKHQTQEHLAGLCDCTPTHICNIENGKIGISLELLFKISIILGKSMDYFVMDHPGVNPAIKINAEIAPKLTQCDSQMLDMVDHFLDSLISFRDDLSRRLSETNRT